MAIKMGKAFDEKKAERRRMQFRGLYWFYNGRLQKLLRKLRR